MIFYSGLEILIITRAVHWLYWSSRTLSSSGISVQSDVIMWHCTLAYSETYESLFLNKKAMVSKKKNPLFL